MTGMPTDLLTRRGGRGQPLILVHGLMGRGSTWPRQLPWLTRLGTVYTYDAPWHRGRDVIDPYPISTERFVADLGDAVASVGAPVRLVAHSMGALHSWCLAAERPDLVSALVLEDMAPDFRGRSTGPWEPWLHSIPVEFRSTKEVFDNLAMSQGSISWMPSTALPPAGGCTATRRNGSRSPPNGAPVTTGTNGWLCGRHPC